MRRGTVVGMATVEVAREAARGLARSYEAIVAGRLKFRVGRIVYVAFSRDESRMGFAFPKELRAGLVESEPDRYLLPARGDMRYNWVVVRLDAIDDEELRQLVVDAWAMCVPKGVAAAQRGAR